MRKTTVSGERRSVRLTVNGQMSAVEVEPRTTLLDALHEGLGLTGTKKACDRDEKAERSAAL